MMKILLIGFIFLGSFSAQAEHDATYCGHLSSSQNAQSEYGDSLDAVILIKYSVFSGDVWDDQTVTVKSYAGLMGLTDKQLLIVEKARQKKKMICVRARWGGSLSSSRSISKINLITDAIERLDYSERFNPK